MGLQLLFHVSRIASDTRTYKQGVVNMDTPSLTSGNGHPKQGALTHDKTTNERIASHVPRFSFPPSRPPSASDVGLPRRKCLPVAVGPGAPSANEHICRRPTRCAELQCGHQLMREGLAVAVGLALLHQQLGRIDIIQS